LALAQSRWTAEQISRMHPDVSVELVTIRTTGDANTSDPFKTVGQKGMFVREIEEALLAGDIDIAVHSLKDLPGELPDGLDLFAVPKREDPRDALISSVKLNELTAGAIIGTSSIRRQALIRSKRPDLDVRELRGNLDTRLRKLDAGDYHAIVLACAGLERMGWTERIGERLDASLFVPAPGQGALAIEGRMDDESVRLIVSSLDDPKSHTAVSCERAFQAKLGAGCTVPVGALATVTGNRIQFTCMVAAPDGSQVIRYSSDGSVEDATRIGVEAAEALLNNADAKPIFAAMNQ
jgi:hydroxymethylbilane synthase